MSFLVGFSTPKQGERFPSFIPSLPFLPLPSLTFPFTPLKTPKQSLSDLFQGKGRLVCNREKEKEASGRRWEGGVRCRTVVVCGVEEEEYAILFLTYF
ncbi:hypothetical protein QL285_081417 [Trifolium repens]|nr:hypothetical protein QL285_081417 [Trifolium repens]